MKATSMMSAACAAMVCSFAAVTGFASEVECASSASAGAMPDVDEIVLPGEYLGHLQDVCMDGSFIYWAHTQYIVKTDLRGNLVDSVEAEGHNAGCAVRNGRLYVAVCPLVPPPGVQLDIAPWTKRSRLQIDEYDAKTLTLVARHVMPANDRAGSLAILDDGTFVVGCLRPDDISKSQVRFHHVSADFKVLSTHVVDDMEIPMGIETIKLIDGYLYMMCYYGPTLKVDPQTFAVVSRMKPMGGETGYIADGKWRWRGVTERIPKRRYIYTTWRSKLVRERAGAKE